MNLEVHLALTVLLWGVFAFQLWRAAKSKRLQTPFARSLWVMAFFGALIFTLYSVEMDARINSLFGQFPLTVYLKFYFALMVTHFYYSWMLPLHPAPTKLHYTLHYLCPVVGVLGLLVYPLSNHVWHLADEHQRLLLVALRDMPIMLLLIVGFIPIMKNLWQQETVPPMKVKHLVSLTFNISYLIGGAGSILGVLFSFTNLELASALNQAFWPTSLLCGVLFIISLMPHRWMRALFYPQRWYLLLRLRQLTHKIARLTSITTMPFSWQGVEANIYRRVIFVLDYYPSLNSPENATFYRQIAQIVDAHTDYATLVRELANIA